MSQVFERGDGRRPEETARAWKQDLEFDPRMDEATRLLEMNGWHRAVERSLGFAKQ